MQRPQNEHLVVRQHERVKCALDADVSVALEHRPIVALTGAVSDGNGKFMAAVVDISRGGIALRSKVFLPKQCRLVVRIIDPRLLDAGETVVFTCTSRVMRVQMVDRTPTYELGTAFVDLPPEGQAVVAALIKRVAEMEAANAAAATEGGANA